MNSKQHNQQPLEVVRLLGKTSVFVALALLTSCAGQGGTKRVERAAPTGYDRVEAAAQAAEAKAVRTSEIVRVVREENPTNSRLRQQMDDVLVVQAELQGDIQQARLAASAWQARVLELTDDYNELDAARAALERDLHKEKASRAKLKKYRTIVWIEGILILAVVGGWIVFRVWKPIG